MKPCSLLCFCSILALAVGSQAKSLPEGVRGSQIDGDSLRNAPSAILIIRPDGDSTRFAIRPDVDTAIVHVFDEYFPCPELREEEPMCTPDDEPVSTALPWEVHLSALLSRGRCGSLFSTFSGDAQPTIDNHAALEASVYYRLSEHWATGLTTGYMHSVGPYSTRYVPLLLCAEYRANEFHYFTPYAAGYAGLLYGIGQGKILGNDTHYPQCGKIGFRLGVSHPLWRRFHVRAALDLFCITNNRSHRYARTQEWGIGPCGSIIWK